MILCLNCAVDDELLKQLYRFTHSLEPFESGVYLEVSREEADLIADTYDPSAGLAHTKEEARLLSLTEDELWVKTGRSVDELSVGVLEQLGLKPTTVERLTWLGVEKLADLEIWSKAQLQAYLGDEAKRVLPYLKGAFTKTLPVYTPKVSLSESYSFDEPVLEPYRITSALEHLCERLSVSLADRAAARLELTALSHGLAFSSTRIAKESVRNHNLLMLAHQALEDTGCLGLEIDKLELSLKGIYRPSEQGRLFNQKKRQKEAVAKVEARYPGAMLSIVEADPYSLLPEFRYSFKSVHPINGEVERDQDTKDYGNERSTDLGRRTTLLAA